MLGNRAADSQSLPTKSEKLAERTGSSTVEIGSMIRQIQDETKAAVESMDTAVLQGYTVALKSPKQ